VRLLAEAAGEGARLAVLPETFVPLYPSNLSGGAAAAWSGFDELWEACARSASTSASPRGRGRSTTRSLWSGPTGCCIATAS
jgi:predicted amidohydrolase